MQAHIGAGHFAPLDSVGMGAGVQADDTRRVHGVLKELGHHGETVFSNTEADLRAHDLCSYRGQELPTDIGANTENVNAYLMVSSSSP